MRRLATAGNRLNSNNTTDVVDVVVVVKSLSNRTFFVVVDGAVVVDAVVVDDDVVVVVIRCRRRALRARVSIGDDSPLLLLLSLPVVLAFRFVPADDDGGDAFVTGDEGKGECETIDITEQIVQL
jgi:hypothetical protein